MIKKLLWGAGTKTLGRSGLFGGRRKLVRLPQMKGGGEDGARKFPASSPSTPHLHPRLLRFGKFDWGIQSVNETGRGAFST